MLTDMDNDVYGIRYNDGFIIGNRHVQFTDNILTVGANQFQLSVGLKELLNKRVPSPIFTNEDLLNYKQILVLTSAHKRKYDDKNTVNANSSWKYINIISKLFPSKRPRKNIMLPPSKLSKLETELETHDRILSSTSHLQRAEPTRTSSEVTPVNFQRVESETREIRSIDNIPNTITWKQLINENEHDILEWNEDTDPNELVDMMRIKIARRECVQTIINTLIDMRIIRPLP